MTLDILLTEKLTGLQLVRKFPAFNGTQSFITAFTRARQIIPVHGPIPLLEHPF